MKNTFKRLRSFDRLFTIGYQVGKENTMSIRIKNHENKNIECCICNMFIYLI